MRKINKKTLIIALATILAVSVAYAAMVGVLTFAGTGVLGEAPQLEIRDTMIGRPVMTTVPDRLITISPLAPEGVTAGTVVVSSDAQTMTFTGFALPFEGSSITVDFAVLNVGDTDQSTADVLITDITIDVGGGFVLGEGALSAVDIEDFFEIEFDDLLDVVIEPGVANAWETAVTLEHAVGAQLAFDELGLPATASLVGASVNFTVGIEYGPA